MERKRKKQDLLRAILVIGDKGEEVRKMLYIKAEMGIDDNSIIAQIERVKEAEVNLRIELDELDRIFNKINVVEKGTPENLNNCKSDSK